MNHGDPRPARVVVLVPSDGAASSRVVLALKACRSFQVHVATSVPGALRLATTRRAEAVVLDDDAHDGEAAARPEADLEGLEVVRSRLLTDAALVETLELVVRAQRVARAAAGTERRLDEALAAGLLGQWRFDPEARSFAWLASRATPFAEHHGEGSVHELFLDLVHPDDRARVERAVLHPSSFPVELRLTLGGKTRVVEQTTVSVDDLETGRTVLLGTMRDVTELRATARELERHAFYDGLTSLPNRAHVARYLRAALGATRGADGVAVLAIGIEGLGLVNATFGAGARDAVVIEVSRLLREVVDAPRGGHRAPGAMAGRHGTEELVVVVPGAGEVEAQAIFAALLACLETPLATAGATVVVSCVAGITVATPDDARDAATVIARADAAMHVARAAGRGAWRRWTNEMQAKLERRQVVEAKLREVLAGNGELDLHYQPKVSARRDTVDGVEALLRWSPAGLGPLSPLEVISVAEESGLIHDLGWLILRTACVQARCWSRDAGLSLRVAVNVSASQLASADFAERVAGVLAETGLGPELLELEITEGAMMADPDAALAILDRVKALGIRIALDDFGTGYSSLAHLTRFPIDCLKIDRSFVIAIGKSEKGEAILRAMTALARSLELEVVAEGVETAAQQAFVAELDDVDIQGWFYSKALPAHELVEWLQRRQAAARTGPDVSASRTSAVVTVPTSARCA